jgi:hypothetical protein
MSEAGRVCEVFCMQVCFCNQGGGGASIHLLTYWLQSGDWKVCETHAEVVMQNKGFLDLTIVNMENMGHYFTNKQPLSSAFNMV